MNTIKTLVVVTTLLAVGYGAHVVLNKPIPNGQFAQETEFPQLPGFAKPSLKIDSGDEGPSVSLPPLQPLESGGPSQFAGPPASVELPPLASAMNGGSVTNRFARSPSSSLSSTAPSRGLSDNVQTQGFPAPVASGQSPATAAQAIHQDRAGGTIVHAVENFQNGGQNPTQNIPSAVPVVGSEARMASAATSGPRGARGGFDEMWHTAQLKLQSGQLVDAMLMLSMFCNDTSLTAGQRDQLIPLLDQIAGSVIYSDTVHIEAPYQVRPGETLESVAQSYGLAPSFIVRTNGLSSPILQPGQQIKVVRGPFRGELSLARREITLFAGRYYAGRFPVAIGRDLPTQASVLEVIDITGPRPYDDPRTGERIPAGDGNSPYGNHWIGLRDAASPERTNLGLHSSGSLVDASDSRGCISLSDQDADDLQAIFAVGSRIQIVP